MDQSKETICLPKRSQTVSLILKNRYMYLLLLPGIIWVLLFCYGPMFGLVIAFQDYKLFFTRA